MLFSACSLLHLQSVSVSGCHVAFLSQGGLDSCVKSRGMSSSDAEVTRLLGDWQGWRGGEGW